MRLTPTLSDAEAQALIADARKSRPAWRDGCTDADLVRVGYMAAVVRLTARLMQANQRRMRSYARQRRMEQTLAEVRAENKRLKESK